MVSLFERLGAGRPPQQEPEPPIQAARNAVANLAAQHKQAADIRAFLTDILANGPMPINIIDELGATRGFSARQLRRAKERTGIVAFKKKGKIDGPWLWTTTQHASEKPIASKQRTRQLRNISNTLGYRLQRIGKYPRGRYPRPAANKETAGKSSSRT